MSRLGLIELVLRNFDSLLTIPFGHISSCTSTCFNVAFSVSVVRLLHIMKCLYICIWLTRWSSLSHPSSVHFHKCPRAPSLSGRMNFKFASMYIFVDRCLVETVLCFCTNAIRSIYIGYPLICILYLDSIVSFRRCSRMSFDAYFTCSYRRRVLPMSWRIWRCDNHIRSQILTWIYKNLFIHIVDK